MNRYSLTIQLISAIILIVLLFLLLRNMFLGHQAKRLLFSFLDYAGLMDKTVVIKTNGKIIKIGSDWETILNKSVKNIIGKTFEEIFSDKENMILKNTFQDIFNRQLAEHTINFYIKKNYRIIATYIPLQRIYCILLIDLSEQEHLKQVKHWAQVAQKLAHGIKNPLTTVKLNAEELHHLLYEKHQLKEPEIDEYFDAIVGQVTKLKKMSDGFMRFMEFERPELKSCDLNREVKELVQQWIPKKTSPIHIDWELDGNLPPAKIDNKQFEYVLKNVFYNAVESLSNGGRILISTQQVELFSVKQESHTGKTYVELQIRDTGCGIPSELLDKVTLPYFTSNKPEGTGLGLSIVQKIMDSFGGDVIIDSEEGVGTTVTLRFSV